jgi:hypothetical protein
VVVEERRHIVHLAVDDDPAVLVLVVGRDLLASDLAGPGGSSGCRTTGTGGSDSLR